MKIEFAVFLTVMSVCGSIYFGLTSVRRNQRISDQKEASRSTSMLVKIENIGNGVNEIKADIKTIRDESRENRDKIIRLEASVDGHDKRLDKLEGEMNHDK